MKQEAEGMTHADEEYVEAVRESAPATTQAVAAAGGGTRQGAGYRPRSLGGGGGGGGGMVGDTLVWGVAGDA